MLHTLSAIMRSAVFFTLALAMASAVKPKRGFVGDCDPKDPANDCVDPALLTNTAWVYSYNVVDNYAAANIPGESARFVPMHWCVSSLNDTIPAGTNMTYMMGFNEPNNAHNCNMSPQAIAQAWSAVLKRWPDSLLVSPATAGDGRPWFDAFFAECKTLYGPTGCNITYLAVHDYSCDAPTTMSYLQDVYQRYGYPVWLTEFSCGDGSQGRPTKDHLAYMKAVVPLLDAAPYVYRYSWMSARDKAGLRGLVAVGSDGKAALTEVGQLYNSL